MLRSVRRAWRCDCDGVSHLQPGRPYDGQTRGYAAIIARECGSTPPTCPWRSPDHPLVQDIYAVRSAHRANVDPGPLSQRLTDACSAFQAAFDAASEERRKAEDAARKAASHGK